MEANSINVFGSSPTSPSNEASPEQSPTPGNLSAYSTLAWLLGVIVAAAYGLVWLSTFRVTERLLLFSVILAGASAATLQASTALLAYIGQRQFRSAWIAYFVLRPVMGAAVALLVYILLRASFVNSSTDATALNYYGVLAISFGAGLFSRELLSRVSLIFESVFSGTASGDKLRDEELSPAKPFRRLDRYHGFLVHQMRHSEGEGYVIEVTFRPKAHPTWRSNEIDIGEGSFTKPVKFQVRVHSFVCDPEPTEQEVVVYPDGREPETLKFKVRCPAGVDGLDGVVEAITRGRTVALIALTAVEQQTAKAQTGAAEQSIAADHPIAGDDSYA